MLHCLRIEQGKQSAIKTSENRARVKKAQAPVFDFVAITLKVILSIS